MKNENKYYLYKSLLLNNNKIYDKLKDYNINENIDEIINIKEKKEYIIKGHNKPKIKKKQMNYLKKKMQCVK